MSTKQQVYDQLELWRNVLPSDTPEGSTRTFETHLGRFAARRDGTELYLYPPVELRKRGEPVDFLVFGVMPLWVADEWHKPIDFDGEPLFNQSNNFGRWWQRNVGGEE